MRRLRASRPAAARRARLLAAVGACAVAALVPAAAHGQDQAAPGAPAMLLPDLQQAVPSELGLAVVRKPGAGLRVKLGFRSTTGNIGLGSLTIDGSRASRRHPGMRADQVVTMSDGTTQTIRGIGGMHYVRWRGHQHWHFDEFMRYELRSFDGKALVATDEKRGFCLGDRLNLDIFTQAVNEPRSPVFRTNCGWHLPGLLHVHEGISVGNADFYTPQLEGQDIDVTNIPSGEYWLVHTANPARRLRESDYSNDSSSVLLRFAWKRITAYRRRLVVTPLIDCPGAARCNPPSSSGAAAARTRALALRTTSAGRPLSVTPGVTRVSALSFVCHLR